MITLHKDDFTIEREQDVIFFRNRVKEMAVKIGLSVVSQTKLITAASELVRNMLNYAKGGIIKAEILSHLTRTGIRLVFEDKGPGIENIDLAMREGFTTNRGLGLGLPGARKLVDEFTIKSVVGEGTTVSILMWKNGR